MSHDRKRIIKNQRFWYFRNIFSIWKSIFKEFSFLSSLEEYFKKFCYYLKIPLPDTYNIFLLEKILIIPRIWPLKTYIFTFQIFDSLFPYIHIFDQIQKSKNQKIFKKYFNGF